LTRKKTYKYIKRTDNRKIGYKKNFLINLFKKNKNLYKNKIVYSKNFFKNLYNIKINNDSDKNISFSFKKSLTLSKIFDYRSLSYFSYFIYFNKFFFLNYKNIYINKLIKFTVQKTNFLFYNYIWNKVNNQFFLDFINLFKKLTPSLINDFNQKNKLYIYYYFYINSFIFLNLKTSFYNNLIKKTFLVSQKISTFSFFNITRLSTKPTQLEKKIEITNIPLVFIYKLNMFLLIFKATKYLIFKKYLQKKLPFYLKKNKMFNMIFKKSFINYYFTAKNYFLSLNFTKKPSNKRLFSIFKLSSYDWISETLAKLTKDSIKFDLNNFMSFRFFFNPNINQFKLVNLLNLYNNNDFFFENNYFFLSQSNLINNFHLDKNFNKFNFSITLLNLFNQSKISNKLMINNTIKSSNSFTFLKLFKPLYNYNFFSNSNKLSAFYKFNKFETLTLIYSKPLFFKFIKLHNDSKTQLNLNYFSNLNTFVTDYFFYSKKNYFFNNNLIPHNSFFFLLKKKMLKIFNYSKFPTITSIWCYNSLIKFLEFCSGKKIYLKFNTFLSNNLNFLEKAQCLIWAQKVKYFRKVLGPRLFLNESLQIIYLALKLKDPYVLSNWMISTMQKISFWKYKTFLRYIKYVLRYFFWVIFKQLNVKGVKFQLKGKISVAGNARTRTVLHTIGFTSHTTFNNKILYKLSLIKTFTGALGLKLWIVF